MKINLAKILLLSLLLIIASINGAYSEECPICHATGISTLVMNCPECGGNLHDPSLSYHSLKKSSLKITLFYTGSNPERMPPYGKIYINNKYVGNAPMIEKEINTEKFSHSWSDGLGKAYTAYYEKTINNVPSGVLKIEVEMKFDRLYGFLKSQKRVSFPYISFKPGEDTVVEHFFNSATTFHLYKPKPIKPIPIVSEMKLQGASGSVALNIPLFK